MKITIITEQGNGHYQNVNNFIVFKVAF